MTDVGRRFRATRVLELEFELTDADVERGESDQEAAEAVADATYPDEWAVINQHVDPA